MPFHTEEPIQEDQTWQALESGKPLKALEVWEALISQETNESIIDDYESNSAYALIALGRVSEAREIYLSLFDKYQSHKYAHQLCMVEREDKNYDKAIEYLQIEKTLIKEGDVVSLAANLYELGKIKELQGQIEEALIHAQRCLELSLIGEDVVMLACAYRLLGDTYSHMDLSIAQKHYLKAQEQFLSVGDKVGAGEIEKLLQA